jgi:toxin ParE1/3/4
MNEYLVHPEAEQEAEEAAEWYAARSPNLGIEFARQYALAVEWISDDPKMYPLAEDAPPDIECRNMTRLGRFPYRVVYAIVENSLYIVAVAHTSRRPGYWQDRLSTDSR